MWEKVIITIVLCLKVIQAYQDNTEEYWKYMKEVAQAKLQHDYAVYEQNKYQKYDDTPPDDINTAAEEEEDWVSKLETKYARGQGAYGEIKDSKPVLDTASEKEKSETRGHLPTNQLVVKGYDAFSNTLNSIIDKPWNLVAQGWDKWLKFWDFIGSKVFQLNHVLAER